MNTNLIAGTKAKTFSRETFFRRFAEVAAANYCARVGSGVYRDPGFLSLSQDSSNVLALTRKNAFRFLPTETANFLFWLTRHDGSAEDLKIDQDAAAEIVNRFPHLVYVPETVITYHRGEHKGMASTLNDWWTYPMSLKNMESSFLSKNAFLCFQNNRIPLLLADAIIPDDIYVYPQRSPVSAILFFSPPVIFGLLAALQFAKPDRRSFLKGLALTGTGILEEAFNPFVFKDPKSDQSHIDFRNALIALKLLQWARQNRYRYPGDKPTFLLTMGAAHHGIMDNIRNGEEYNTEQIRSISQQLGLNISGLGDLIAKYYYYHPYEGGVVDVTEHESETIRGLLDPQ